MISVDRVDGDEYRCYCPFHEDSTPSLCINIHKNAAICFAGCYSGDLIGFISKYSGVSRIRAVGIDPLTLFELSNTPVPPDYLNTMLWESAFNNAYLNGRGFSNFTIKSWQIEYNDLAKAIRIPVYDDEHLHLGYIHRFVNGRSPKYKYTFGFSIDVLFGVHNFIGAYPILVEGSLDTIWLNQCGIFNSLALLGSSLKSKQFQQLKALGFTDIILCLDNDHAGKEADQKIKKQLERDFSVYNVNLPEYAKDVQEMPETEVQKLFGGG